MKWEPESTFDNIAGNYVRYVKSLKAFDKAHDVLVVFDGYGTSTKEHGHSRRGESGMPEVEI